MNVIEVIFAVSPSEHEDVSFVSIRSVHIARTRRYALTFKFMPYFDIKSQPVKFLEVKHM